MFIRRALIIACTGEKGKPGYIPGTLIDKDSYKKYLKSYSGGSWEDDEIHQLINPTISDVEVTIYSMGIADFSLVVFSGHGGTYKSDNRMVIELGNQELNVSELRTKSPKQIIILDTCRTYITENMIKIAKSFTLAESIIEKNNSRKIYEEAVMKCEAGNVILYSCGKNEASNDDSALGGYFSYSLLQTCEAWVRNQKNQNILNIKDAFCIAKEFLNNMTTNQNPELSPSYRINWFPFAISKNFLINFLGL